MDEIPAPAAEETRRVQERRLPDVSELLRLRGLPQSERPTLQAIADRYGTSRQAVHKALDKHKKEQEKRSAEKE